MPPRTPHWANACRHARRYADFAHYASAAPSGEQAIDLPAFRDLWAAMGVVDESVVHAMFEVCGGPCDVMGVVHAMFEVCGGPCDVMGVVHAMFEVRVCVCVCVWGGGGVCDVMSIVHVMFEMYVGPCDVIGVRARLCARACVCVRV